MRQIMLDTETTGLDPAQGHRIIELAAVVVSNRRRTDERFHRYLNPDRPVDAGAMQVHGISDEFLQDKPRFRDVAAEFLDFIRGAELVIHNAPFDVAFLDSELALLGMEPVTSYCASVVDTLKMAKDMRPGKRNSLDALCAEYGVDNSGRTLHGALLDAELLADVYLKMTQGQDSLLLDDGNIAGTGAEGHGAPLRPGAPLLVLRADAAELAAHEALLADIARAAGGRCVWQALSGPGSTTKGDS